MTQFGWNDEKSLALKAERGVFFEHVVFYVAAGGLLDVLDHPNPDAYPGQRPPPTRWLWRDTSTDEARGDAH